MRIPLDYYRILGITIQATDQQIKQAYQDRTAQLPRREYSNGAITSRNYLLDRAYGGLINEESRNKYDRELINQSHQTKDPSVSLPTTKGGEDWDLGSIEAYAPTIEIEDQEVVGGLLLLLELGEYTKLIRLGRTYLSDRYRANIEKGMWGDPVVVKSDLILTLALGYLELAREQWQQGQYETAAKSDRLGQQLLLEEGLFPSVRGEIQADLYKLRPYRVLELVALNEVEVKDRQRGISLLKEMLNEREGIDGKGKDRSGLNTNDFLRFIQQLRAYLTTTEQQEIFSEEAKRPSPVATYLAVYAFLAGGYAHFQPALIVKAQNLLRTLGKKRDVYLEQAICSLLLGQTEHATIALENSQDKDALNFIRDHSRDAPDLLPGLCLYTEQWLQTEVFSNFRDLNQTSLILKEYFAEPAVESYLEQLTGVQQQNNEWSVEDQAPGINAPLAPRTNVIPQALAQGYSTPAPYRDNPTTVSVSSNAKPPNNTLAKSPRGKKATNAKEIIPETSSRRSPRQQSKRNKKTKTKAGKKTALWVILLNAIVAFGLAGIIVAQVIKMFSDSPNGGEVEISTEQLSISIDQPVVDIPLDGENNSIVDNTIELDNAPTNLSSAQASKIISNWLSSKALAFSQQYQVDSLSQVLSPELAADWSNRAKLLERDRAYRTFNHTINQITKIEAVGDAQAIIEAEVREVATHYENGEEMPAKSYDDQLMVRYQLSYANDKWLITKISVL
ncbi:MAG: DUF4101 domain-containing protein [Synechococcaceae cyanobacterium RL_1_2]|nr:DUF4101 domain-containing protein [Synechococcaceae cyanobacterium RL_1_2]